VEMLCPSFIRSFGPPPCPRFRARLTTIDLLTNSCLV
jgi:hypothetical protein